ncbi:MAG TPA: restriction endonuclease [Chloroflexota bacterium]|nr:restriction endonuclease [Chloroflexota bacterium]HUM69363.1 restriction endonuclease [Chloroflexota bacterium]
MAVPDFQTIMLPLMQFAADGKEHSLRETIEFLADQFQLTREERKEMLPSGRQATLDNRVGWSRTHLTKAGLLTSTKRGYFQITERGRTVLAQNPNQINVAFLKQFPEYLEFIRPANQDERTAVTDELTASQTPEEAIEAAYQRVRQQLANDLLQTIRGCSPAFFERLVVDLLVQMGYGGTRKDAGEAIGGSGDEGIDGIIKEDRLGLDIVYIQAKRWKDVVSRPEIQKFAGALQGQRARKGIFITTSTFSESAKDYVSRIDSKIVLIDGNTLAQLMIDYNIGVAMFASYEMKRIDSDYFSEE